MLQGVRRIVYLAVFLAACLPAACSAQGRNGQGEYRQFADSRGRAVQARVLRINGDKVTIERRDGKQFTVAIATFSQADQDFIRGLASRKMPRRRGSDWSRFRGPDGMGVSDATGLPLEWDQTRTSPGRPRCPAPARRARSSSAIASTSPATPATSFPASRAAAWKQLQRHLIAVRLDDGQILWDKASRPNCRKRSKIRDHGFAANSPAADAERVYVFFGKSGVFAFDHEGKQLWQADVGSKTNGWGTAASPVLYKDLVFINASVESESLVALDRRTGEEKWRAGGIRESWNTPLVVTAASGRQELIVAVQGSVLAFDPESGEPLWSCKTDIGWYMVPSVVAADGVVYCLGGRSGTAALAVRAGGSGDVTADASAVDQPEGLERLVARLPRRASVLDARERGIAYCAKAATGEIVYEQRLDRAGQVYASALLADGRLYYVTRHGKTFVLAAKPQFEQLAVNDLSDRRRVQRQPRRGRQPPAVAVGQVPVLHGEVSGFKRSEASEPGKWAPFSRSEKADLCRLTGADSAGCPRWLRSRPPRATLELRDTIRALRSARTPPVRVAVTWNGDRHAHPMPCVRHASSCGGQRRRPARGR